MGLTHYLQLIDQFVGTWDVTLTNIGADGVRQAWKANGTTRTSCYHTPVRGGLPPPNTPGVWEMLMDDSQERTGGGSRVYRHEARTGLPQTPAMPGLHRAAIQAHIAAHIGPPDMVYDELLSNLVHLDVHIVEPTSERPICTLVTSGMSNLPMALPPGVDISPRAELLLCLSPEWSLDTDSLADERRYWPLRWLKTLARLPHTYNTWLAPSHTVPNGEPPAPFAPDTYLCAMLVSSPMLFGDGVHHLRVGEDTSISFYSAVPLYKEELDLKLARGFDALLDRMAAGHLTELLDIRRPNLCMPRRWGGLRH